MYSSVAGEGGLCDGGLFVRWLDGAEFFGTLANGADCPVDRVRGFAIWRVVLAAGVNKAPRLTPPSNIAGGYISSRLFICSN
jgi:hypothetical protein